MNLSLTAFQKPIQLPSFLKPQARWVPKIAGQAARLGTLAALGYTGYQAYAHGGYSLADSGVALNAALLASPVLAAKFNSTAAESLATRALWKPIQKEKLEDPDQVLNKAVLASDKVQEAIDSVFPGTVEQFQAYLAAIKRQALTSGLLYAGLGTALTIYYLNQFG